MIDLTDQELEQIDGGAVPVIIVAGAAAFGAAYMASAGQFAFGFTVGFIGGLF